MEEFDNNGNITLSCRYPGHHHWLGTGGTGWREGHESARECFQNPPSKDGHHAGWSSVYLWSRYMYPGPGQTYFIDSDLETKNFCVPDSAFIIKYLLPQFSWYICIMDWFFFLIFFLGKRCAG